MSVLSPLFAFVCGLMILAALPDSLAAGEAQPEAFPPEQIEFFETRVRPLLVAKCFECHGPASDAEGGLRLDRRSRVLTGGSRGPAIAPGKPAESPLIDAVNYREGADLEMPPDEKLSLEEIADLTEWVEMGAPWPEESTFSNEERGFWSFQPIADPPLPEVQDTTWPTSPIDRFILRGLEDARLNPSPPCDKYTLLRRLTFDLTGLPPTPAEIEAFISDDRPDAVARVIERLLASPQYGERWARHWLDVVRYAETNGFEIDSDKPHAYLYRDYVTAAFNEDVPFDLVAREHLAGDLLPPRVSRDDRIIWSPVGTSFLWLGAMVDDPADYGLGKANEVEDRVATIGSAFLGMTLACARCHDHKFDPVRMDDYHSLAGFLTRSKPVVACVDSAQQQAQLDEYQADVERLASQRLDMVNQPQVLAAVNQKRLELAGQISQYLMASHQLMAGEQPPTRQAIVRAAKQHECDPNRLAVWHQLLERAEDDQDPIFYLWSAISRRAASAYDSQVRYGRLVQELARTLGDQLAEYDRQLEESTSDDIFVDNFEHSGHEDWTVVGPAFAQGPIEATGSRLIGVQGDRCASSFGGNDALLGRLVSPPITVQRRYLTCLMAGGGHPGRTCLNVLLSNEAIPDLEDYTLTANNSHRMVRRTLDLRFLQGVEILVELVDNHQGPWGHIIVDDLRMTDTPPPQPPPALDAVVALLDESEVPSSIEHLADAYEAMLVSVLEEWQSELDAALGTPDHPLSTVANPDRQQILSWALSDEGPLAPTKQQVLDCFEEPQRVEYDRIVGELKRLQLEPPTSSLALVAADGEPPNADLQMSGFPEEYLPQLPRGFLGVIVEENEQPVEFTSDSGRLELAEWIGSPDNPLTARVMVNRLWQHHFGRGLVATPNNFGTLGERPSHPELLDYLASRFIESGWSIKAMHRLMLMSSVYRQSSNADPLAMEQVPDNRLLHHMPIRRLEAECIRDSMLAVAGTLDRQMGGPSQSLDVGTSTGPLSLPEQRGHRRSLYLEIHRNRLPPMLSTFDFPNPQTSAGERRDSFVPLASLLLLNSPFVHQQADAWAQRLEATTPADRSRVQQMYHEAFGRPATEKHLRITLEFVSEQAVRFRREGSDPQTAETQAWSALCHSLLNLREFHFVR